jgi:cytochrome c
VRPANLPPVRWQQRPHLSGARSGRRKGTNLRHLPAVLAITLGMSHSATAESPRAQRGMMFARTHCATCHSIDKLSPSPLTLAPPFRALHLRYPVESLEEALAEGIVTGHPTMPEFRLEPDQIGDFMAFLKSLEP